MRRILLITARMHPVTRITLRTSPMMRVMIPTQRIVLLTAPMIILRMIMQELSMMTASIQMKQRILPVMILIQMIPARIQALTVLLTAAIHLPATAVLLLTPVRELTLETSS